ncbi:MAG TPA: hypothetical protein VF316_25190 [Polyangiaceae bacterium]
MRRSLFLVFVLLPACGPTSVADGPRDAAAAFLDGPVEAAPNPTLVDGGYPTPDGGTIRADRFVTGVVDFQPGDCAGFGIPAMPGVVEGPPVGFGSDQGSTNVVSLGRGGSITVSFGANAIVDGPGPDFVVFENAFYVAGDPSNIFAEPGEVSVSDDGVTWKTYPCTATKAPYGMCAGWHPVYSAPDNAVSPVDYPACGGDAFDLTDVGLASARFVRIRDMGTEVCPVDPKMRTNTLGFDLDAVAILNAKTP